MKEEILKWFGSFKDRWFSTILNHTLNGQALVNTVNNAESTLLEKARSGVQNTTQVQKMLWPEPNLF